MTMLTADAQARLISAAWKNALVHAPGLEELPDDRPVLWRTHATGEVWPDEEGRIVFRLSEQETLHVSPDSEGGAYLVWKEGTAEARGRVYRHCRQWGPEVSAEEAE